MKKRITINVNIGELVRVDSINSNLNKFRIIEITMGMSIIK